MTTVRLKRHCAGSYVSADGRFEIFRNPSAANMWGDFSEPWEVNDYKHAVGQGRVVGSFPTLRDARTAIARRLAKET